MHLYFDGISSPVKFCDDPALQAPLSNVFAYWGFREGQSADGVPLAATVRRDGDGYRIDTDWRDESPRFANPVNLVCGLVVALNQAWLNERQSHLCLHGAGIEIGGRLVVLPNFYRAGKSALTVCLAAAGGRVFSDDILPVLPDNSAMALGVSPRLRLPLPGGLGRRSLQFIGERRGAANSQYQYVDLEAGSEQAPFGETTRFGGFVLLDRRESGPAGLIPVGEGETMKSLVLRNFARQVTMEESLDRLHALIEQAACYRLVYSNGDEAADLLMERFTDTRRQAEKAAAPVAADRAAQPPPAVGGAHPCRRPAVGERFVGEDLFLVGDDGESVYHLNLVGAGLWRLLDGRCSLDEAKEILCLAFPDIPPGQVGEDVERLVADLTGQGLLLPAMGAETA